MKINHMNCTIELTKTEMKAAEKFGSEMYLNLREARQDNPNYRVKVVTPSKKVDHHKGLTADRMKKYILKHDDEEHSKLMEFYELRGLTSEGKKDEAGCPVSYGELKQVHVHFRTKGFGFLHFSLSQFNHAVFVVNLHSKFLL